MTDPHPDPVRELIEALTAEANEEIARMTAIITR